MVRNYPIVHTDVMLRIICIERTNVMVPTMVLANFITEEKVSKISFPIIGIFNC